MGAGTKQQNQFQAELRFGYDMALKVEQFAHAAYDGPNTDLHEVYLTAGAARIAFRNAMINPAPHAISEADFSIIDNTSDPISLFAAAKRDLEKAAESARRTGVMVLVTGEDGQSWSVPLSAEIDKASALLIPYVVGSTSEADLDGPAAAKQVA